MEEKPVPQEHGFKHKQNVRIRKGVIKPNDPREKGTTGGTGPLNIDVACTHLSNKSV